MISIRKNNNKLLILVKFNSASKLFIKFNNKLNKGYLVIYAL